MQYELKNEKLTVCFDTKGAEMTSLKNNRNGQEYLWNADAKFWGRHAPVLFRLEQDTVSVMWKVLNREKEKDMYFSIGAHPAFMCPLKEGEKQSDYSICMDKEEEVEYYFINVESGLMLDDKKKLKLNHGCHRLEPGFFDESAYIIEDSQVQKISLLDPENKPYITVSFQAPLVGVWSPEGKNAPFVCIEPWYGRCDRQSFNGTLEEREWGNKLAPGEVFACSYEIKAE